VDSERIPFKLKLYPPLKNKMEGVHLVKGGNILEYKVKMNALSKPRAIAFQLHLLYREYKHLNTSARNKTPHP
jgi:hypothetical protein